MFFYNKEKLFKLKAKQVFKIKNVQPKIEDGAFTWGLEVQCRKGIFGQVFNELLEKNRINWKLVNFKIEISKSLIKLKNKF